MKPYDVILDLVTIIKESNRVNDTDIYAVISMVYSQGRVGLSYFRIS